MKEEHTTDPYRAQKAKLMEAILRVGLQKKGKLIQALGGSGMAKGRGRPAMMATRLQRCA